MMGEDGKRTSISRRRYGGNNDQYQSLAWRRDHAMSTTVTTTQQKVLLHSTLKYTPLCNTIHYSQHSKVVENWGELSEVVVYGTAEDADQYPKGSRTTKPCREKNCEHCDFDFFDCAAILRHMGMTEKNPDHAHDPDRSRMHKDGKHPHQG